LVLDPAQDAARGKLKRFYEYMGVDKRSSQINRPEGFCEDMINLIYSKQNEHRKRKGYKAIAGTGGGHGLFPYSKFNMTTGSVETKILSISSTVQELQDDEITISYSGASVCTVSVIYDTSTEDWRVKITEGGSEVLNFDCGEVIDESSSGKTLADLKTAIDAVTNFSSSISGTTTTHAGFLNMVVSKSFTAETGATLKAHHWENVNAVQSNMLSWFEENKDNDEFENCKPINWRGSAYFPNPGEYKMLKWDGQTLYKAGVPKPTLPTVEETNAASGVAEITDVTCRAYAGIAEVFEITCVADDTGIPEISEVDIDKANINSFHEKYFTIYDKNGRVDVWFDSTGSGVQPSSGANRYIEVTLTTNGTHNIAEDLKDAMDADSQFSATRDGDTVTITDAENGARSDISEGTLSGGEIDVAELQEGTSGLRKRYFKIYSGSTSIAAWMKTVSVADTAPGNDCDENLQIDFTAGGTDEDIAEEVKDAIDADSRFSASRSGAVVTVTLASVGDQTDPSDSDSFGTGFTFNVTTQGRNTLEGTYFYVREDGNTQVAIWHGLSATPEPSHGAPRAIKVTLVGTETAAQVASQMATDVGADSAFSTSNPSSTVCRITDAANGARTNAVDGNSYHDSIVVQTEGVDSGLGQGDFIYRFRHRQVDANGKIISGNQTEDVTVTHSSAAKDSLITLFGAQADSGYNTQCAIVNGNQSGVTAITVDSGHTHVAGNQAYLINRATGKFVTRTISSVAASTINVDEEVDVSDDDVISNGLGIEIWRTKKDLTTFYYLDTIPNDSINGSFTWQDSKQDSELTVEWRDPLSDRSPPRAFKYLGLFGSVAVATGFLDDADKFEYSDWRESIEYWPISTNFEFTDTDRGDRNRALFRNNEVFVIGKAGPLNRLGSVHVITGFLDELLNFSREAKTESIGITSQNSIVELQPGANAYMTTKGPHLQIAGNVPSSISDRIEPIFTEQTFTNKQLALGRVVALNDAEGERIIFFLPVEPDTGTKYATDSSQVWVYDYSKDPEMNPRGRWFEWTNMNMAGGIIKVGNDIYFSERRFSTTTLEVEHYLYKIHNTGTIYDYADQNGPIESDLVLRYEDGGLPDIDKELTTIVLKALTAIGNAFSLSATVDLNRGQYLSAGGATLSFDGDGTESKSFTPKNSRHESFRLKISNSQMHKDICFSGFQAQLHYSHDETLETR
jgi:hypothetical protein